MVLPLARSACAAAMFLCAAASAQTPWLRYDAGLGTLPAAQGFAVRDDGWSPAPRVVSGELQQGLTDFNTLQMWYADHEIDFDRGVVVEGMINVASSTYDFGTCGANLRFGYYMGAVDVHGRIAYIGISSSKLFVLRSAEDQPSADAEIVTIPMQNLWRDLKMVIRSSGVDLFVDGTLRGHYPLGPAGVTGGRSRMLFGDGTSCGASRTRLRWVEVRPIAECRADFNGDGFVDFSDYDAFVACFEGEACPAGASPDFNGDGFVDMFDYDDFMAAFEWGCDADGGAGNPDLGL